LNDEIFSETEALLEYQLNGPRKSRAEAPAFFLPPIANFVNDPFRYEIESQRQVVGHGCHAPPDDLHPASGDE
jgi:hypothetical protein